MTHTTMTCIITIKKWEEWEDHIPHGVFIISHICTVTTVQIYLYNYQMCHIFNRIVFSVSQRQHRRYHRLPRTWHPTARECERGVPVCVPGHQPSELQWPRKWQRHILVAAVFTCWLHRLHQAGVSGGRRQRLRGRDDLLGHRMGDHPKWW